MIDAVKIARALSDPVRYKIMVMLAESEEGCCSLTGAGKKQPGLCNCEFMARLGMIQSRVSYHMKELVEAGLVCEEQRGRWKYYYINVVNLKEYLERLKQDLLK